MVDKGVSGGVETWKNTKRLVDRCNHLQEMAIIKSVRIIEEYHFSAFQERCMPSSMKRNLLGIHISRDPDWQHLGCTIYKPTIAMTQVLLIILC